MSELKTVVDILKAGRQRLTDLAKWTQGCLARDALGTPITTSDVNAVCWCAFGVLYSFNNSSLAAEAFHPLFRAVHRRNRLVDIGTYNDAPERTHEEILALYDDAIAEAASTGTQE